MSDEEDNQYEVEAILEARPERKRGKIPLWKYHVKWKGYGSEDNTWEREDSFEGGSENLIEEFWDSVDTGGRDRNYLTQFSHGESLLPRRQDPVQVNANQAESETEERSEALPASPADTSKRQRSSSPGIPSYPPAKRIRATPEAAERPVGDPETLFLNEDDSSESVCGQPTALPLESASEEVAAEPPDDPITDDDLFGDFLVDIPDDEPEETSLPSAPVPPPPPLLLPAEVPPAPPPLPSHRARVAKPLVKMIGIGEIEGEKSVKRRLHTQNTSDSVRRPSIVTTNDAASQPAQNVRAETSRGLPARNSSLLTFGKGGLKILKRANVPPPSAVSLSDLVSQPEADIVDTLWNDNPQTEGADLRWSNTASGDELLKLAGYSAEDAAALPDFEDDVVPETPRGSPPQSISALPQENQISPSPSPPSNPAWKQTTIFGPLGLGLDARLPETLVMNAPSVRPTYYLNLDNSVAIPIVFKDISPANSASQSLSAIVSQSSHGPPGKFYKEQPASALLDTLSAKGSAARVCLDLDADGKHQQIFDKFHLKLRTSELFIAMAGSDLLAFCASENKVFGEQLGVPSQLLGLSGCVVVSEVSIRNHSAYADAAVQADTVRWW